MKALTICQPYAEMIARGEKVIENRTWPTPYRGPLVIHAGKSRDWLDGDDDRQYPGMVFGAVVATANLADCVLVGKLTSPLREHVHANGPWCWVLEDIRRVEPVRAGGAQGLWEFPDETVFAFVPATGR